MTDSGAPPGPAEQATAQVQDGHALFAAGEVERARECFERALALVPGEEQARVGLERCTQLMADASRPAGDSLSTPAWPMRAQTDAEDSETGAPEATVVDPLYVREAQQELARLQSTMTTSSDFPEPKTTPSAPMPVPHPGGARISSLSPAQAVSGGVGLDDPPPLPLPPGGASSVRVEPTYPRYSSAASRHYPELLPGGRQHQPSAAHGPSASQPAPAVPSAAQPAPGGQPYPPTPYPPGSPAPAYPPFTTPSPGGGPMALAFGARPQRWALILAGVGVACALVGFLIGLAVFRGDGDGDGGSAGAAVPTGTVDAAPAAALRPPTRDAGPGGAAVTPDAAPAAGPAGQVIARAAIAMRPVVAALTSPVTAEVTRMHAADGDTVKKGARLFTLRPADKKKKDTETVIAPAPGLFAPALAKGDRVDDGGILGELHDPSRWWIVVDLPDTVSVTWTCEVATGDGASRTACTIERVERLATATRTTASVKSEAAPWLGRTPVDAIVTVTPPAPGL